MRHWSPRSMLYIRNCEDAQYFWHCTLTTNMWVYICKTNYTYMSLMDLFLRFCVHFMFNLSGAAVEKEILPTICHLLCNGQKLVFWGGGNLPLHFRFWSLCVKWLSNNCIYFCERGPSDSFVPNFVIFDDTFVWLRMNPEKSLCKGVSFYSHFSIKTV